MQVDALLHDIRHASRRLIQSPGFTAVAVLTLALGVGANAAIFQLVDAVRLRSLPVAAPHELAEVRIADMKSARGHFSMWHAGATNAIWEQIRARQQAFSGVFAWSSTGVALDARDGEPRFAKSLMVSGDFFETLGVRPQLGRLLTAADDQRGCSAPGAVLSHAFWQSEFGGDPSVIGRKANLARYPFEIVGVTPEGFSGLEVGRRFDVAVPLCAEALPPRSRSRLDSGTDWWLIVMGRLKPGWSVEQASAHLASISPAVFETSLPSDYPKDNVKEYLAYRLKAEPAAGGVSMLREQYSGSLWLLQATAALVLLIGCANLANLMLARASAREREISVRLALGAGRGRVARLLLAESLLLAVFGSLAGVWLADSLSRLLLRFIGGFLELSLDFRMLGFASLIAALTCALFGLAPALRAAGGSPEGAIRASGRGTTERQGRFGLRRMLVVSQVALSLVLVAGAFLFARTLHNLMTQDLGLRPDGITIAYVDMSRMNLPVEQRAAFKRELFRSVEAVPGVLSVAETSVVPLSGSSTDNEVWPDGAESRRAVSFFASASGAYFKTMGIPLLAGRGFDDTNDTPTSPRVAIVNQTFATKFFDGANPVGRQFWREATPGSPSLSYEIVGLVKDAKYENLRQELRPIAYLAVLQNARPGNFAQLLIRTSMPSATAVPMLKGAFKQAGAAIVPTFQDFRGMVDNGLVRDRLVAALSSFFGVLAMLLATLGLYGLVSFAVARRTQEIGVRMALGADAFGILKLILSESLGLIGAGLIVGGVLALVLSRSVGALVYGLAPNDPLTLLAAAVLLAAVALGASVLPARRAARLDPNVALRLE